MKTTARNREYARIKTIQDLHYQRRLLKSKIDHEEVMIMYRFRSLWDFLSPSRLAVLGIEALASHNRKFGIFFRSANFIADIIRGRRHR